MLPSGGIPSHGCGSNKMPCRSNRQQHTFSIWQPTTRIHLQTSFGESKPMYCKLCARNFYFRQPPQLHEIVADHEAKSEWCSTTLLQQKLSPFSKMADTSSSSSTRSTRSITKSSNFQNRSCYVNYHAQRMRLMPLMNELCRYAGSDVISSCGTRRRISSNITAISRRAKFAPKQKCGPPAPNPT